MEGSPIVHNLLPRLGKAPLLGQPEVPRESDTRGILPQWKVILMDLDRAGQRNAIGTLRFATGLSF